MSKRADDPVLFLDESNDGPKIAGPLREAGLKIVCLREEFPRGTNDVDWIPVVAARGWLIVSCDRAQDIRNIELLVLYRAGAKRFLVVSKNLGASGIVERILKHYRKIVNRANSQPAPFVFSIRKDGVKLKYSKRMMKDRLGELLDHNE